MTFDPQCSVADPGCFSRSRIRLFSIPDPGSASKNLNILTQKKWFLSSRIYDPGCSSFWIPDPDPDFFPPSRIPDPGVKKAPDPGSGSATLLWCVFNVYRYRIHQSLIQTQLATTNGSFKVSQLKVLVEADIFRLRDEVRWAGQNPISTVHGIQ